MKNEDEPVSPEEWLIRLIWTDYYDISLPIPIQASAFTPRKNETDGISVFRSACVGNPKDALAVIAEDKRDKYAIALLLVADVMALGLSVAPAKIDAVPGHAVLPELNIVNCKTDKTRWRGVQKQLANLASKSVVQKPKDWPTSRSRPVMAMASIRKSSRRWPQEVLRP
jgi:hypothetical protein